MADAPLTPCGECGMPGRANDYHPYAACLMFKACHSSEVVRANLDAVVEHGRATPSPPAPPATPEPFAFVQEMWDELARQGHSEHDMRRWSKALTALESAQPQPQPAQPLTGAATEPVEEWVVVKEHVWHHEDGGRPTLAYLWPSEFEMKVHPTAAAASAFIKEWELPLGWVRAKLAIPGITAPSTPTPPEVAP